jgi:hypothetical protein
MVLNYLHPRSACFYFLIILFTSQGPRRVLRPSSSFLLYFLLLHRAWERVLRPFFMIFIFIIFIFSTSQGLRHVLSQALVLSFLLFFLLTGLETHSWASFQALILFCFFPTLLLCHMLGGSILKP